jgi:hypothetical protein
MHRSRQRLYSIISSAMESISNYFLRGASAQNESAGLAGCKGSAAPSVSVMIFHFTLGKGTCVDILPISQNNPRTAPKYVSINSISLKS